jgi:hypothetical protein
MCVRLCMICSRGKRAGFRFLVLADPEQATCRYVGIQFLA